MKNCYNTLFSLIRLALGTSESLIIPSDINWKTLLHIAEKQGVLALTCDGINTAFESSLLTQESISPAIRMRVVEKVLASETRYSEYLNDLESLLNILKEKNIAVLLLKGYPLSLNYPIPSHRPMGDADIYPISSGFDIPHYLEEQFKISVDYADPHHAVFYWKSLMVECHNTILDITKHRSNQAIETLLESMVDDSAGIKIGEAATAYMPSAKFNSLHLIRHMGSDFATAKTSLRHLLDWALFVKANRDLIDWDWLFSITRENRMDRFLNAINTICVDQLGFPATMFPVQKVDKQLANRVLNDILEPEFNDAIPDMHDIVRYAIVKTKRLWANRWKYRIVYKESLFSSFVGLSKNRLRNN